MAAGTDWAEEELTLEKANKTGIRKRRKGELLLQRFFGEKRNHNMRWIRDRTGGLLNLSSKKSVGN